MKIYARAKVSTLYLVRNVAGLAMGRDGLKPGLVKSIFSCSRFICELEKMNEYPTNISFMGIYIQFVNSFIFEPREWMLGGVGEEEIEERMIKNPIKDSNC